jgi:uncharacterized membrane-anchored protein YjiN (DUF445 family)
MAEGRRVGYWATVSLGGALAVAVLGEALKRSGVSPFWGGLIAAFGEAALVGGLADWFAVRALFGHPLGITLFPHTAIIPRNRQRIVREVRNLVQNEWLPQESLTARVNAFDFVGDGLLALMDSLRPKLREVLRTAAREVLGGVSPQHAAAFLAQAAGNSLEVSKLAPFLSEAVRRVREGDWLMRLLREWVGRFRDWSGSPASRAAIHGHLKQAADRYRKKSLWKDLTLTVAQVTKGVDLDNAADLIQDQVTRFAEEQLEEESHLQRIVQDGLADLERRLAEDPEFAVQVRDFLRRAAGSGSLGSALEPLLTALKAEGLRELEKEDSRVLDWAMAEAQKWVDDLAQDPEARERLNAWCRQKVNTLIAKHHALIGAMVEDRLNRFTDENLVEMIEAKVGEDLNWIRINGSLVGGLVGVFLYLAMSLLNLLFASAAR